MTKRTARVFLAVFIGCALTLGASFQFAAPVTLAATVVQKKFDPEGDFNPKGTAPKGLEEVGAISLYRRNRHDFLASGSGVHTTRGTVYKFKTISVSREKLVFTTVARGGVSYSFTGRFLKGGVFAELALDMDTVVLEGHLTKLKAGSKVAEGDMQFTYFGGT